MWHEQKSHGTPYVAPQLLKITDASVPRRRRGLKSDNTKFPAQKTHSSSGMALDEMNSAQRTDVSNCRR